ncbi:universal stress protein [Zobellia nedashkovskayae]|uniref:universal stress protein n=1 Tax=Zobellia nedashkovskayae TaxID=2779510 RepID=UPI00188B9FA2|nr:universal stress protein [Zobellia nedashkovskayae]
MKNILIPTDFSDNAWNAIEYGIAFLKKTKCKFHIVHVNPIASFSDGEVAMYASQEVFRESLIEKSLEKLQKLLEKIERLPLNTKHTFYTSAFYGFFTDYIKEEVKNKDIDFIIMGTKGANGIKAVSMGSNTGNVITKVKCPVLAVPQNAEYHRPKEIVFPTDYYLSYDIKVLENIKELASLNHSTIRFLYLSKAGEKLTQEQTKNQEFLSGYFSEIENSFHKITGEKLETAVQCFTESRKVDMIVMVAKNLNFLERILFKPKVEKISYHITIPFLVLHE